MHTTLHLAIFHLAKVGSDCLCTDLKRCVHRQVIHLAGSYCLSVHLKRWALRCGYNPALTCQFHSIKLLLISAKTDILCAKCQQYTVRSCCYRCGGEALGGRECPHCVSNLSLICVKSLPCAQCIDWPQSAALCCTGLMYW